MGSSLAIWTVGISVSDERRIGRWQEETLSLLGNLAAWLDEQDRDEENPFLDAVDVATEHIRQAYEALFWWEEVRVDGEW